VPPSKQARSRQARQKERLAAAAVRRHRAQRRRRLIGAAVAAFVILALLVVVLVPAFLINDDTKKATVENTNTTTAPAGDCVAVKDPLPKGAPAVPVQVGAPPAELVKKDLKLGTGAVVKPGATITANYIGVACTTGKIFDSSWSRGQPAEFPLSGVIKGWTDGIPGMKVGGRRLLGIPAAQAYGATGQGALIGPNEPLWFVVDVVSVK
jgi:peptidylprolyl isomerase